MKIIWSILAVLLLLLVFFFAFSRILYGSFNISDSLSHIKIDLEIKRLKDKVSVERKQANDADPNKAYVHSAEDIERMRSDPTLCFKNTDCQQICLDDDCTSTKPIKSAWTCNRCSDDPGANMYSYKQPLGTCTMMACPLENFGYAICNENQCSVVEVK